MRITMKDGKTYRVRFEYPVAPGAQTTERRRTIAYVERLLTPDILRLRGIEPEPGKHVWDPIGVSAISRYFKDKDRGRPVARIIALTGALKMSGLDRETRAEIWAAFHDSHCVPGAEPK